MVFTWTEMLPEIGLPAVRLTRVTRFNVDKTLQEWYARVGYQTTREQLRVVAEIAQKPDLPQRLASIVLGSGTIGQARW